VTMAWQEVTPLARSTSVNRGVRVSVSERLGVIVSMNETVAQALGWKGKQQLKVFVGAAELLGKLRLTPDAGGIVSAAKNRKGGFKCMLLRVPGLSEAKLKAQPCSHQVDGKSLIVTLPAEASRPVALPRQPALPSRSVDVTNRIAGPNGHGGR
jgi:hypothetical protein